MPSFVDDFNSWWPRDYTWAGDDVAEIGIEAKPGGRCFERTKDGSEAVWGTVLDGRRPNHIVLAWQIGPDRTAEDNEAAASRVDVRFTETGPGTTDVILVHRDFPRHGEGWEVVQTSHGGGQGLAAPDGPLRQRRSAPAEARQPAQCRRALVALATWPT